MASPACQRWHSGNPFWVDPDQCIQTREYDVVEIPGDAVAKEFIITHHYAPLGCVADGCSEQSGQSTRWLGAG